MNDDDKTTTGGTAADDTAAEPAAEEAKEEVAEVEEPKTDAPAQDAAAPTAPDATSAGTDQQGRTLYDVKCSNCGKMTQVPFKPSGDRPVYCKDCYMQKKNDRG